MAYGQGKTPPDAGFTLLYTLLYPGFLGAFILSILKQPPNFSWPIEWDAQQPWAVFFAIYFALQHVQATRNGGLDAPQFIIDALEMAGMIALFYLLGYFIEETSVGLRDSGWTTALMALLLVLPSISRAMSGASRGRLTILSAVGLAFLVAARCDWICEAAGFWGASAILALYAGGWVFTDKLA